MRIAQGAGERCHRPLCHVQRLAKAPTVHVHHGQSRLGRHQDVERATGGSQGEGALARRHGVLILVHAQEGETQLAGDPPAPPVIVQLLGEGLGRTQGVQYTGVLIERQQGVAQIAAQVNGLFQRAARLGAAPGRQRLLKIPHGFAVRRARHSPGRGLLAVGHGLVPSLTSHGMMGQALHLLGLPLGREGRKILDDPTVQNPSPLLEQTIVGHLMRQGV